MFELRKYLAIACSLQCGAALVGLADRWIDIGRIRNSTSRRKSPKFKASSLLMRTARKWRGKSLMGQRRELLRAMIVEERMFCPEKGVKTG